MILSSKAISKAISEKQINIICHYFETVDGEQNFSKNLDCRTYQNDLARKEFLERQIEGTRIALTMGPLIYILAGNNAESELRYHHYDRIADLTSVKNSNSHFWLQPGDIVEVLTNEYLKLDKTIGGFIFPRVNNNSIGLEVKSSYVSNGWNGLLKLTLKNESKLPIQLKHGMNIAALFLYQVDPKNTNAEAEEVHFSANHHGITWQYIYNRVENPFTPPPKPPTMSLAYKARELVKEYKGKIFDVTVLVFVISAIYMGAQLKTNVDSLNSKRDKIDALELALNQQKEELKEKKFESGVVSVTLENGKKIGRSRIDIASKVSNSYMAIVKPEFDINKKYVIRESIEGTGEDNILMIEIEFEETRTTDTQFKLKWILFP